MPEPEDDFAKWKRAGRDSASSGRWPKTDPYWKPPQTDAAFPWRRRRPATLRLPDVLAPGLYMKGPVAELANQLGKRGIDKEREGDQKTPIGVYQVTSRIAGSKLPDLYGWGAFPLDYPNEWDRLQRRTGYGIWIHGVPADTYARSPQASDGCIALANPEIEQLSHHVRPGATPVVIARRVEWVSVGTWRTEREELLRALEAWRLDWESRDSERYLAHYANGFRSNGMDLERWRAHKRRVNAAKAWIRVSLAEVSVLRDPGAPARVVATFEQDYRSSNLAQKARKRQYWVLEDGRWKIAYEGVLGRPVLALPESFPVAEGKTAASERRSREPGGRKP